jgi:D-aspartate ligase
VSDDGTAASAALPAGPRAVVVGLDCITGLQTARLLAARGVPVVGVAGNPRHFCCRTNVCRQIVYTDIKGDLLIETLRGLGATLDERAVLYPCTDLSVLLISRHRRILEQDFHVVLPAPEVVEMLMDKISFLAHARERGLAIPPTRVLHDRGDAEEAASALSFPVILKPPLKTSEWERHTNIKAFRLNGPRELLDTYDRLSGWTDTLIAQEWVEGGDEDLYSCNCYFDADSQPLVTFVARKLRQWPPQTGTSSLGQECRNEEVLAETIKLFGSVGFRGLGYLEMKRDSRTGLHYIIEPNIGRPTGRSAIAEAGGVELLYSMWCDTLGLPLPPSLEQRYTGAKWLDLRRDSQSALYYMRRRELTLAEWRRSWSGPKSHAVLSRGDMAPFWADLWQSAEKAADRLRADGPGLVRAVAQRD